MPHLQGKKIKQECWAAPLLLQDVAQLNSLQRSQLVHIAVIAAALIVFQPAASDDDDTSTEHQPPNVCGNTKFKCRFPEKSKRHTELSMRANHPQFAAKRKLVTKAIQRPIRPEPGSRSVQRDVRIEPAGKPVQRAVRPEPVRRSVSRSMRYEPVAKPVRRGVPGEPLARPVQRGARPGQVAKPAEWVVRPERVKRPGPVSKPAERVVRPEKVDRPAERAVKPVPKSTTNADEIVKVKEEPKKQEGAVKKEVTKSPAAPGKINNGDYELNTLMKKTLDVELKYVIEKVLQDLADVPIEDIESGVAETLRSAIVPDMKNILGLNITKRLLNVYNPLNVKVKFNGKPEKEELREFLKKYNFIGFVREAVNIFAAQVKGIADFDKLCKDKEVRCGNVKVTITPVYSFATCPPNLITKYIDINSDGINIEIDKDTEMDDTDNTQEKQGNKDSIKKEISGDQPAPLQIKKESPVENKDMNKSPQTINKAVLNKPQNTQVDKTENKVVTPTKPQTKVTTPQKQTTVTAPTKITPPKIETKANPTKTVTNAAQNKATPIKPAPKVAPTNSAAKVTPTKATPRKSTKASTQKKSIEDEDDYDELDDHDILALMSEGIVLDECIGSEEE